MPEEPAADGDDEKGQLLPDAESADSSRSSSSSGAFLECKRLAASPRRGRAAAFARARLGLLAALAGTLTFSLMTVCVRLVPFFGPPVPAFFIVVVRGCIVSTSSLWSLCTRRINPLGPRPYFGWLLFRGSMGFAGLSTYYYGLYRLRIADAVVLQKTCPVLVRVCYGYIRLPRRRTAQPFYTRLPYTFSRCFPKVRSDITL